MSKPALLQIWEDEERYKQNLARAEYQIFSIARHLQRIAFIHTDRDLSGNDWRPAPLYLDQAVALYDTPELAKELISLLTAEG